MTQPRFAKLRAKARVMVEYYGGAGQACTALPGHVHSSSLRRFTWGRRGGGPSRGAVEFTLPRAATVVGVKSMIEAWELEKLAGRPPAVPTVDPVASKEAEIRPPAPVELPSVERGPESVRAGLLGPSPWEVEEAGCSFCQTPERLTRIEQQLVGLDFLVGIREEVAAQGALLRRLCREFEV